MIRLTIGKAAAIVGGKRRGEDAVFRGVSLDTRSIRKGELFVAIKGQRHDGHVFVRAAAEAGAAGAMVVDESAVPAGMPAIVVGDTRLGLLALAAFYRAGLGVQVAAITGSNGKTTTKELLGRLLSIKYRARWAPESYNNDIGVPLTVFSLSPEDEAAVFEIEMNQSGGTLALARVCRPKVGVITNVHDTHLEFMHDRAGVAAEKAELLQTLPPDGVVVLNGDDEMVSAIGHRSGVRQQLWFGLNRARDVFAAELSDRGIDGVSFRLNDRYPVRLRLAGVHNVSNCLAACAAAAAMGIDFAAMPEVLERFEAPQLRLRVRKLRGMVMIEDCYNANPQSVRAGLDVLRQSGSKGNRVAILGDMLELGAKAESLHLEIGMLAAGVCDRLGLVGGLASRIADGAISAGLAADRVCQWPSAKQVGPELFDLLHIGDTILVKGSRAMGLESLVKMIASHYGEDTDQIH
ncbi:MAG: UDP-N-acetylmuramoyl-tripeptide--D-alanyl-D-alanine ligase [candidate division WOR-3 bacterium]